MSVTRIESLPEIASEVLDELNTRATRSLVDAVSDETIADLLEIMPVNDAAEVLSDLREDRAQDILALMEPADAAEVKELLGHEEDSAGRLMSTEFIRLHADWTVEYALQYLRSVKPETGILAYLYVVNGNEQLVGVVPLRSLITASPDTLLADIMTPSVISVREDTDQEEVARLVSQNDFFAIPVVNHSGRLVGIITHDDVMDILHVEFTEDMQRLGGSEPLEGEYLSTPVFGVVRKRIGWLMVLFLTEMLTGTVIRAFEGELQSTVALAFFIPLLIGTGGNSGSQTTSTVIRAIAVGEVHFKDSGTLLWHELRTGMILGLAMGLLGFARAAVENNPLDGGNSWGFSVRYRLVGQRRWLSSASAGCKIANRPGGGFRTCHEHVGGRNRAVHLFHAGSLNYEPVRPLEG